LGIPNKEEVGVKLFFRGGIKNKRKETRTVSVCVVEREKSGARRKIRLPGGGGRPIRERLQRCLGGASWGKKMVAGDDALIERTKPF